MKHTTRPHESRKPSILNCLFTILTKLFFECLGFLNEKKVSCETLNVVEKVAQHRTKTTKNLHTSRLNTDYGGKRRKNTTFNERARARKASSVLMCCCCGAMHIRCWKTSSSCTNTRERRKIMFFARTHETSSSFSACFFFLLAIIGENKQQHEIKTEIVKLRSRRRTEIKKTSKKLFKWENKLLSFVSFFEIEKLKVLLNRGGFSRNFFSGFESEYFLLNFF